MLVAQEYCSQFIEDVKTVKRKLDFIDTERYLKSGESAEADKRENVDDKERWSFSSPSVSGASDGAGAALSSWRNSGPRLGRFPGSYPLNSTAPMTETADEKKTPLPAVSDEKVLSTPVSAARASWDLPIPKAMSLIAGAAPLLDQVALQQTATHPVPPDPVAVGRTVVSCVYQSPEVKTTSRHS
ncbi:hypothetical protein MRX96_047263 [Rhipicephalus microplus]